MFLGVCRNGISFLWNWSACVLKAGFHYIFGLPFFVPFTFVLCCKFPLLLLLLLDSWFLAFWVLVWIGPIGFAWNWPQEHPDRLIYLLMICGVSCITEKMDGHHTYRDTCTYTHTHLYVDIIIHAYTHTVLVHSSASKTMFPYVPLKPSSLGTVWECCCQTRHSRLRSGQHPAKCSHTTGAKQAHAGPRSG